MKYLALIYSDETGWERLTDDERAELQTRYMTLSQEMASAGVMVGGDRLTPTRDATTVRVRDAQTLVTDGPYAEVKEALGGYYLLDCSSLEEALDWAARIPAVERSGVEVRPVYFDPEEVHL
jgi:hypothetical protein